jgi:hypothetical protein
LVLLYTLLPNSVNGSITRFLINEKLRSTAKPSKRKGNNISQIKGYRIMAIRAKGQHNTKRIHQSRKFNMLLSGFLYDTNDMAIRVPNL